MEIIYATAVASENESLLGKREDRAADHSAGQPGYQRISLLQYSHTFINHVRTVRNRQVRLSSRTVLSVTAVSAPLTVTYREVADQRLFTRHYASKSDTPSLLRHIKPRNQTPTFLFK